MLAFSSPDPAPSVAVLDGSVTNRRIFRNVLDRGGFATVHLYGRPKELLDLIEEEPLDLLVAHKQIVTPGAYAVLHEIRETAAVDGLTILVTAYQFTSNEAIEAIRNGADELLLLPFTPEKLMEKVARVTDRTVDGLGDFSKMLS